MQSGEKNFYIKMWPLTDCEGGAIECVFPFFLDYDMQFCLVLNQSLWRQSAPLKKHPKAVCVCDYQAAHYRSMMDDIQ